MRVLVLGGSLFLSRAVADAAVARGHDVVCASRGMSGSTPPGARSVVWDRTDGAPPPSALLSDPGFDAVVDVARLPSWVRTSVAAFPDARHAFVSTVNVYADDTLPGQTPATGVLRPAHTGDDGEYGPMKVACEDAVRTGTAAAFVVRPGLIAGPGDPSGRFTYWPARLAAAGTHPRVLAPGDPADVVQVIDARDLAAWIVTALESGTTGTYDGVGAPVPIGGLLTDLVATLAPSAELVWVPTPTLEAHHVQPWSGERSVPLWLPRPAYDGMVAHDVTPSLEAGLRLRPATETAHDVLAWLRATPDAVRTGLTLDEEAAVLAAVAG